MSRPVARSCGCLFVSGHSGRHLATTALPGWAVDQEAPDHKTGSQNACSQNPQDCTRDHQKSCWIRIPSLGSWWWWLMTMMMMMMTACKCAQQVCVNLEKQIRPRKGTGIQCSPLLIHLPNLIGPLPSPHYCSVSHNPPTNLNTWPSALGTSALVNLHQTAITHEKTRTFPLVLQQYAPLKETLRLLCSGQCWCNTSSASRIGLKECQLLQYQEPVW